MRHYRHSPNSAHRFLEEGAPGGTWRELWFEPGRSVHYTSEVLHNPETVAIANPSMHLRRNITCRIRGTEEVVGSEQSVVGYTRTKKGQLFILVALQESSSNTSSFLVEKVSPNYIQPWDEEKDADPPVDHIAALINTIDAIDCAIRPSEIAMV